MEELASGSGKVEAFSFNQDTGDLLGNHRTLSDASLYVRLLFKGFSRVSTTEITSIRTTL